MRLTHHSQFSDPKTSAHTVFFIDVLLGLEVSWPTRFTFIFSILRRSLALRRLLMDPIVRAALRERQNLLEELNRNPQFRRLQAVNEIIRVYGDEKQPAPVAAAGPSRPSAATPSPSPPSPQPPAAEDRPRAAN